MSISETSRVEVHYVGSFDTGEVFDTSRIAVAKENKIFNEEREYNPLPVEMGKGQVIPGFESALIGMKVGEVKTVRIESHDAYGSRNEELLIEVPDTPFKENKLEPQEGMMIQTSQGIAVVVKALHDENKVILDFNHPMAGKDLTFELEVMKID